MSHWLQSTTFSFNTHARNDPAEALGFFSIFTISRGLLTTLTTETDAFGLSWLSTACDPSGFTNIGSDTNCDIWAACYQQLSIGILEEAPDILLQLLVLLYVHI